MAENETALVVSEGQVLDSPMPAFRGPAMTQALAAYRELQQALDKSMPDQIMELEGKMFRKKGYWRAVAVAFNLTVEEIDERREEAGNFEDGRPNFGYVVTYRASTKGGRTEVGDGACFAVEKARRFKCPHPHPSWKGKTLHFPHKSCPDFDPTIQWKALPGEATEHNVRSHAHTRAFNRAVSNLVGFGEVSADELTDDDRAAEGQQEETPHPREKAAKPEAEFNADVKTNGDAKPRQTTIVNPPAEPSTALPTEGYLEVIPTSVVELKRSAEGDKKPWVLYGIVCAELGVKNYISTFKRDQARLAATAKKEGRKIGLKFAIERKTVDDRMFENRTLTDVAVLVGRE
jgi:hypothetical protein